MTKTQNLKSSSKKTKDILKDKLGEIDADSSFTSTSSKKGTPMKSSQSKATSEITENLESEMPAIDPDELEEQEDAASAEAAGSSGNAAALAAASGSTEMSASFKNFRHHPDMENFYRFIYENDLRHEALAIIDEIMVEKQQRKVAKGSKTQSH